MHTIWVRLNAVVFFGLTVLLGLSCLAAVSKIGHSYWYQPSESLKSESGCCGGGCCGWLLLWNCGIADVDALLLLLDNRPPRVSSSPVFLLLLFLCFALFCARTHAPTTTLHTHYTHTTFTHTHRNSYAATQDTTVPQVAWWCRSGPVEL